MSLFHVIKRNKLFDSHKGLPLDPDAIDPGIVGQPIHIRPAFMLTVFIGGCIGTLVRYRVSEIFPDSKGGWPTATLIVNLFGAFALGLLLQALLNSGSDKGLRRILRLGIGTGFLGAFTTYSTLAVESNLLLRGGHDALAVLYVTVSLVAGVLLSASGIQVATHHHKITRALK